MACCDEVMRSPGIKMMMGGERKSYPPPPFAISHVGARRSPGWDRGDGRQVTVSRGGDCKGISRQTVVRSTDASKKNTCEATFVLTRCQCDSSNTNVIGDPKVQ